MSDDDWDTDADHMNQADSDRARNSMAVANPFAENAASKRIEEEDAAARALQRLQEVPKVKMGSPSATSAPKSPHDKIASRFGGGGIQCTACAKTVYAAEQATVQGKNYHKECVRCCTCKRICAKAS